MIDDIFISKIVEPQFIHRSNSEDLTNLADSIKQNGLFQPIVVRTNIDEKFQIIAGFRRYRACKSLGWRKIACNVVELDDKEAFEVSLIENIQRRTLSPLDEAQSFKAYVSDYGYGGVSELSRKICKSPCYVTKRLKLLGLPEEILKSISGGSINPTVAEELSAMKNEDQQLALADLVRKRHLSKKKVRAMVNDLKINALYEYDDGNNGLSSENPDNLEKYFTKLIIAIRIVINRLATILEAVEGNWLMYETLMQHKNILHSQIDLLIKEKRKFQNLHLAY